VSAGETVPADGIVESGASEVDEALLTGESRAVPKRAGDQLIGGSTNGFSRLVMRIERVGAQTVIAAIGRLLERAHTDKPRIAQLADRIAARFTAAILIVAAAAGFGWWLIDSSQAVVVIVTVLVITCPCALSLATPTALAAATGSLNRLGVWVTRSHALETLVDATHFVFDKTGTVTTGQLKLVGVMPLAGENRGSCLVGGGLNQRSASSRNGLVRASERSGGRAGGSIRRVRCRGRRCRGDVSWVQGSHRPA
jgi:Cu2+-exporting ATPase